MKKNELIRVAITGVNPDGSGYALVEGRELSVPGAFPGDEADVRVLALKRTSARVRLETVVSSVIERTAPRCPHYAICGGCRWQEIPYDVQCTLKAGIVRDAFAKVPSIGSTGEIKVFPSLERFYYRNKMEFSFDSPPYLEGELFLGLHVAGRFDRVFTVEHCMLQSEASNRLITAIRSFALERNLSAYGLKSHIGLLRFLMIRDGKNSGDLMANLVTSDEEFDFDDVFLDAVMTACPETTTVLRSINRGKGGTTVGEERRVLCGNGTISEIIDRMTFIISPDSFFQTNPRQTENLYVTIREFASLTGTERVLDLYCGTGTIGLFLSGSVRHVTGIELVEDAVADARVNAQRNGVDNVDFMAGKVEDIIDDDLADFDVVICDPPRVGIHPKALTQLIRMKIPRLIYVSCNIKALPHDLDMLALAGYRLTDIRVFDMSPHTPHVETVVKLELVRPAAIFST